MKCAKGNVKAGRKEDVPEVVKALRSQKQLKNEKTMDEEERCVVTVCIRKTIS